MVEDSINAKLHFRSRSPQAITLMQNEGSCYPGRSDVGEPSYASDFVPNILYTVRQTSLFLSGRDVKIILILMSKMLWNLY
jgi:hypothetical protein